ncbi:MAG TPA: hypothetical protein VKS22_17455 [Candidatus Binataceae bacterium]|nr:hypothetical protein [Candidatus Binataceae bacterium]
MTRQTRGLRRSGAALLVLSLSPILWLSHVSPAYSWDSRTHKLIVRLALGGLPSGVVKTAFAQNSLQLQEFAVEPDTVLRPLYGDAEGRRHYIDLENFGADPFARLTPNFATMQREVGVATLERSGTLPWAIEDEAAQMTAAWRGGDCAMILRHAGYLAHYVGDASQPLHTTKFFDGYTAADRGSHHRLESSVDYRVADFETMDSGQIHAEPITSVWSAVIAELQQSNSLVQSTIAADQIVRAATTNRTAFTDALITREGLMVARQLADGATVLASIWLFEWNQAGEPLLCS